MESKLHDQTNYLNGQKDAEILVTQFFSIYVHGVPPKIPPSFPNPQGHPPKNILNAFIEKRGSK